jgi:hypothetical protein
MALCESRMLCPAFGVMSPQVVSSLLKPDATKPCGGLSLHFNFPSGSYPFSLGDMQEETLPLTRQFALVPTFR